MAVTRDDDSIARGQRNLTRSHSYLLLLGIFAVSGALATNFTSNFEAPRARFFSAPLDPFHRCF